MNISSNAEIAMRNLSRQDSIRIKEFLEKLSKDESSVLNKSHFLKKVSNKKLFIGRPTQRLRIIYSLYQGEVEILEILTHDRANLFLSKYYTGGKS